MVDSEYKWVPSSSKVWNACAGARSQSRGEHSSWRSRSRSASGRVHGGSGSGRGLGSAGGRAGRRPWAARRCCRHDQGGTPNARAARPTPTRPVKCSISAFNSAVSSARRSGWTVPARVPRLSLRFDRTCSVNPAPEVSSSRVGSGLPGVLPVSSVVR